MTTHLARWVPRFPNSRQITIRQLLNHTAGTKNFTDIPAFERAAERYATALRSRPGARWTPQKTLSFIHQAVAPPGTSWQYSNTNYILLGLVIEAVTHTDVATALNAHLLGPLGLRELVLQPDEHPRGPLARGYTETNQDSSTPHPRSAATTYLPTSAQARIAWTAGGLAATARGLALATSALFNGHMLTPASLTRMTHYVGPGYGLGLQADRAGAQNIELRGHGGEIPGFQAEMWYLPRYKATLVIMINLNKGLGADNRVRNALLEVLTEHLPPQSKN